MSRNRYKTGTAGEINQPAHTGFVATILLHKYASESTGQEIMANNTINNTLVLHNFLCSSYDKLLVY